MNREIIFDTETTGLDSVLDRITEIGALEMVDGVLTGNYYHTYINPQRLIPKRVTEITGLTNKFLDSMRLFKNIATSFLEFVGDSKLVAHNAKFDMDFINAELKRCDIEEIPKDRFIDTLKTARELHVGKRNTLDALCARYGIENKDRDVHSALIDTILLAGVYQVMNTKNLLTMLDDKDDSIPVETFFPKPTPKRPMALKSLLTSTERGQHREFIDSISKKSGKTAQWARIFRQQDREIKQTP